MSVQVETSGPILDQNILSVYWLSRMAEKRAHQKKETALQAVRVHGFLPLTDGEDVLGQYERNSLA